MQITLPSSEMRRTRTPYITMISLLARAVLQQWLIQGVIATVAFSVEIT